MPLGSVLLKANDCVFGVARRDARTVTPKASRICCTHSRPVCRKPRTLVQCPAASAKAVKGFGAAKQVIGPPKFCLCGSGKAFKSCCGPFLDGAPVVSAPDLALARFTAALLQNDKFLLETTSTTHNERSKAAKIARDSIRNMKAAKCTVFGAQHEQVADSDDQWLVGLVIRVEYDGEVDSFAQLHRYVRENGRWYFMREENEGSNELITFLNDGCESAMKAKVAKPQKSVIRLDKLAREKVAFVPAKKPMSAPAPAWD